MSRHVSRLGTALRTDSGVIYHRQAPGVHGRDQTSRIQNRPFNISIVRASTQHYPLVSSCPDSSCECAAIPELDIDRGTNLGGTAPGYDQHVVISTGRSDWRSRIEDEGNVPGPSVPVKLRYKSGLKDLIRSKGSSLKSTPGLQAGQREVSLARGLKKGLGRDGRWFDPTQTISITNSSFAPPDNLPGTAPTASAFVFPAFQWISGIEDTVLGHESFIENYLLRNQSSNSVHKLSITDVKKPVVLICSHNARDNRCGILGPLLHKEFKRQLGRLGLHDLQENIGMCSHIGGHKWAGNLIMYIPPGWAKRAGASENSSALEGRGVWYGRVEPKHIEGLIKETIFGGRVVEDLCRGVV